MEFKKGQRVRTQAGVWPFGGCEGIVLETEGEEVNVGMEGEDGEEEICYQRDELELLAAAPQEKP